MKYTDNAINIITTKTFKGIGRAWIVKNLKGNESIDKIVLLLNNKSKQVNEISLEDFELSKNRIINKVNSFKEACDGLVAIGDKNFPQIRGNVKDSEKPIFLFYKGDINLLEFENSIITVIGLLNPDEAIEIRERKMVAEIVKRDVIIASGLAFGCDSIAHKQALLGGKTIAFLPNHFKSIMPAGNKSLAYEIVEEGGLLVTEYYEDFKSKMELSSRYKERDRLQALFCDIIILAASYAQDTATRWNIINQKLDSGARLAMGFAYDYNIQQAVMYNQTIDANNPMFDLNRQLIENQKNISILTQIKLTELIDEIKEKKSINNNKNLFN